jgi:hypothetical protein
MRRLALLLALLLFAGAIPAQAAAPFGGLGWRSIVSTGHFRRGHEQSSHPLTAAPRAAPLSRVQVVVEFHYRLSRIRVPSGPVRIELANFGQDEHDLTLRRVGTTKVYNVPSALPGQSETVTLRLKPGLYVLKCTMADHALRGMKAHLRVGPRV